MIITVDLLKQIAPGSKKSNYKLLPALAEHMNEWFPLFEIDTKGELCHYLSQTAHESDSFNTLEEYASGKSYEGRKDLGNINPGDGVKFKGKGLIETTGRINYRALTIEYNKHNTPHLDFEEHPELLKDEKLSVWSACVFWSSRDLNTIANMSDATKIWSKKLNRNLTPFEYITWRVNGGFNGLNERLLFYKRCIDVIK